MQEKTALLEDERFLKDEDGKMFCNADFHVLFHGVFGGQSSVAAPRLAFMIMKFMQYLAGGGAGDAAAAPAAAPSEEAAAAASDGEEADRASYKLPLQWCTSNPGTHWALNPESTLTIVVSPEVCHLPCIMTSVT